MKKLTILKGEGSNQHTLYGEFNVLDSSEDFKSIEVLEKSLLRHERPDGSFSEEHKTLEVEKGIWVTGKQVEWNPFISRTVNIWD